MPVTVQNTGRVGAATAAARRRSGASGADGSNSPARPRATARKSTGGRPPAAANRGRQSAAGEQPAQRAKRRYRPGARALKEIRQYQKSTDLLLRKLPFARVVSSTI